MNELFKDVAGYEGHYQVSNFGNVRSLGRWVNGKNDSKHFVKGRVLKPANDGCGYLRVHLCNDGKDKSHRVHRLVATAFIPNPYNLPEVNHIDEVKTNNVVSNLEWCTRTYNLNYGTHQQRQTETQRNDPKKSKKVLQLTLDGKLVCEWLSTRECGRNGFNQGHVWACCCGKRKTHKGYRWMFAEDYYKMFAA